MDLKFFISLFLNNGNFNDYPAISGVNGCVLSYFSITISPTFLFYSFNYFMNFFMPNFGILSLRSYTN